MNSKSEDTFRLVDYPPYGKFYIKETNKIVTWRSETFLQKEPTTIEWLQALSKDSWLIDVGANIGIYSIPASLFHVQKVIAIEPEPLNYLELLRNIDINKVDSKSITTLPIAISSKHANQITDIYITQEMVGSSCNQVGENKNFKLKPYQAERKTRSVYCLSLEHILKISSIPSSCPLHIKIDVDGIEGDVCSSLFTSGLIHRLSSMQVELNSEIKEHRNLIASLLSSGFIFSQDQVNKAIRKQGIFKGFAEYVFIPGFKPSQISSLNLPESIKSQHEILYSKYYESHENYAARTKSLDIEKADKLKPKLIEYSKLPPVGILKGIFNLSELARAKEAVLDSLSKNQTEFSFETSNTGSIRQDLLRTSISTENIQETDAEYQKYIKNIFTSKKLVKSMIKSSRLFSSILSSSLIKLNKNLLNSDLIVISRIRHFVDVHGYYLSKHTDERETLCALIIPLMASGTSTSIASPSPLTRLPQTPLYLKNQEYSHSFENEASSSLHSNDTYHEKTKNLYCKINKIPLNPGDGAVIYNPCSLIFDLEKSHSDIYKILSGHCVFPPINDLIRPILLIDYLVRNTSYKNKMDGSDEFICNLNEIF